MKDDMEDVFTSRTTHKHYPAGDLEIIFPALAFAGFEVPLALVLQRG